MPEKRRENKPARDAAGLPAVNFLTTAVAGGLLTSSIFESSSDKMVHLSCQSNMMKWFGKPFTFTGIIEQMDAAVLIDDKLPHLAGESVN